MREVGEVEIAQTVCVHVCACVLFPYHVSAVSRAKVQIHAIFCVFPTAGRVTPLTIGVPLGARERVASIVYEALW